MCLVTKIHRRLLKILSAEDPLYFHPQTKGMFENTVQLFFSKIWNKQRLTEVGYCLSSVKKM